MVKLTSNETDGILKMTVSNEKRYLVVLLL